MLWTLKKFNLDWNDTTNASLPQLYHIEEFRLGDYENTIIYRGKMKRWHDIKIFQCEFQVGVSVLLYNSRLELFMSKLKSKWSSLFRVSKVLENGAIKVENVEGESF